MDKQLFSELSDRISDYIHGPAREQIVQQIDRGSDQLGETIAATAYRIVRETADQLEQVDSGMLGMKLMLKLATQTIDYLLEIADALGVKYRPRKAREEALLKMVGLHMEQIGDNPEQRAVAEQMLDQMLKDGTYQKAMGVAKRRMREEGVDPSEAARTGEQMAQNKVAQGVQQGLMGQGGR